MYRKKNLLNHWGLLERGKKGTKTNEHVVEFNQYVILKHVMASAWLSALLDFTL